MYFQELNKSEATTQIGKSFIVNKPQTTVSKLTNTVNTATNSMNTSSIANNATNISKTNHIASNTISNGVENESITDSKKILRAKSFEYQDCEMVY